jgi:putative transposase
MADESPGAMLLDPFGGGLKVGLLDRHRFRSHGEARTAIVRFIEGFYNSSRRHLALGYLSPIEYERKRDGLIKPA